MNITERKVYSQNGEDGVIECLLKEIYESRPWVAADNRDFGDKMSFLEIGSGPDGSQCNTRLLRERGWRGLMVDAQGNEDFSVKKMKVTPDRMVKLLIEYSFPIGFPLLSIDVDGNDYYLWEATRRWQPGIVVIEYNATDGFLPKQRPQRDTYWDGTKEFGCSLRTMQELGRKLGYTLVYVEDTGVNSFFIRDDLWMKALWRPLTHRLPDGDK